MSGDLARVDVRSLRVLVVVATAGGGVARHVAALSADLAAAVADVRVAGPADVLGRLGVPAPARRPVDVGERPSARRDGEVVRRLADAAADVHVVHAHGLRAGALAALARRLPAARGDGRSRPGLVTTWHNTAATGSGRGRWRPAGLAVEVVSALGADVVLAASDDLAARARRRGARRVRRVDVTAPARPLGVERAVAAAAVRDELGVAADRPVVLCVARLHHQKGVDVLLDAAPLLRRRDPGAPVVVVAGDGPERDALARRARGQRADVRLLGERDDVAELLAAAAVVVVASRWDARALVAQEAVAAGVPVVATRVGGLPGLLGEDGALLVPAEDPRALAAAVDAVLDDPRSARRRATAAAARAAEADGRRGVDEVLAVLLEQARPTCGGGD